MIDREARRDAMAIASGKKPSYPTQQKALLYGLLAKSLDLGALKDIRLPLAESFTVLQTSTRNALTDIALEGFYSLPRDDRQEIEELYLQRDPRARAISNALGGLSVYGSRRIELGVRSAAERETVTLRTIAREAKSGMGVTERGVQLSGRVPLDLALMHLYDLNVERTYREPWQTSQHDTGEVFVRSAVALDPEDGLHLLASPKADEGQRRSHGPQIGCPASMVRGYIHEIHRIVSETALASGLITTV